MPRPICSTLRIVALRAVAILFVGLGPLSAQRDAQSHERSATPAGARFEIVQSGIAVRGTYKLDKHTGVIAQLVLRADSTLTWEVMPREKHPDGDPRVPGAVNYQIFMSGLGVRFTYLINVNNGATWQLVRTASDTLVWEPMQ